MIRTFDIRDKPKVMKLLRLNTPEFFAPSEENDFLEYLDNSAENYFLVEVNGEVIGGGGVNYGFDNGLTARISWDIIHPDHQGKGVGTRLLQFRIDEIKKTKNIRNILVRTTQFAQYFYGKHGFSLDQISKDYWAKGFDLYQMSMKL